MLFNSVERWGFNINLYDVPDLEAFLRRDDLTSADKKVLSRLVTAIKKRGTDK